MKRLTGPHPSTRPCPKTIAATVKDSALSRFALGARLALVAFSILGEILIYIRREVPLRVDRASNP